MDVAADLNHGRSLAAMWRAFGESQSRAQTQVAIRTSIVCNMLNARYYDSSRGQFETQDPIFLTSSQNLSDPQSLNSYSYSEGNPITKSDPNGKCAGPLIVACIFIIGAGISSAATYASDVVNNIDNNRPNPYTDNLSSPGSYAVSDLVGGVSLAFLQEYRLYSAALSFASSLVRNDLNGESRNYKKALTDAGVTLAIGVGFDSAIGDTAAKQVTAQIGGNIFGSAASIDFQHAISTYQAPQAFSDSIQVRQQAVQTYNAGVSGGGASSQLYITPNGAVINWSGLVISSAPASKK